MIKILKLVSGEDIIADVTDDGSGYRLKNPMKIIASPMGMGMLGYLDFVKQDSVCIQYDFVMFDAEPEDELYNVYNEKFGSGIVLPTSGSLGLNMGE